MGGMPVQPETSEAQEVKSPQLLYIPGQRGQGRGGRAGGHQVWEFLACRRIWACMWGLEYAPPPLQSLPGTCRVQGTGATSFWTVASDSPEGSTTQDIHPPGGATSQREAKDS